MAYRNMQQMAHRALPLVRRVLDKHIDNNGPPSKILSLSLLLYHMSLYIILQTIPISSQDPNPFSTTTVCV